ncbi:AmmeMemoRadiSam system protein A [Mesotoga sp. UBA6090]|uniref:AmmeMemoRadiSam system protein A n=1 Tax=Mesotoga sp. UBA6090 TaxID=1946860 RepID=UPI0025EEE0EE|nr:AmmeMemoRadiSam system protein A [Mesotoga sp. UBA6090]
MSYSEPVRIARFAIGEYFRRHFAVEVPEWVSDEFISRRAGCFVSLHSLGGSLRGCIGTIFPAEENIAREIIQNAISAAIRDPRFPPVKPDDLPDLELSVDILSLPEKATVSDLDPKKFGVVVSLGCRRGVLLPDLEGVNTVHQQLGIALKKAGIGESENYNIFRFSVERYH